MNLRIIRTIVAGLLLASLPGRVPAGGKKSWVEVFRLDAAGSIEELEIEL